MKKSARSALPPLRNVRHAVLANVLGGFLTDPPPSGGVGVSDPPPQGGGGSGGGITLPSSGIGE